MDASGSGPVDVIFLAAVDLHEVEVSLIVVSRAKRMRRIGRKGGINAGPAQDILKGHRVVVQGRPRLEGKRVAPRQEIVARGHRGKGAEISLLAAYRRPSEGIEM